MRRLPGPLLPAQRRARHAGCACAQCTMSFCSQVARSPRGEAHIWAYAFGYFACYAPYSGLTKLVSQGQLPGMTRPIEGFELLPITSVVSLCAMLVFLTLTGWWRHASRATVFGVRIMAPGRWTLLSGLHRKRCRVPTAKSRSRIPTVAGLRFVSSCDAVARNLHVYRI